MSAHDVENATLRKLIWNRKQAALEQFDVSSECDHCNHPISAHDEISGACFFSPGTVYIRMRVFEWSYMKKVRKDLLDQIDANFRNATVTSDGT